MSILKFRVPASAVAPDAREAFYRAKVAHYDHLLGLRGPGAAWFRHQARLARAALDTAAKTPPAKMPRVDGETPPGFRPRRTNELVETYDLFSGGRAMSENLQLDRALPRVQPNETPVKLDSIRGITIQQIDWQPLLKDAKPKLDPLAALIPADQHVVFFPSFQAAVAMADESKLHDTPLLRMAAPRSENARVVDRYQQQLCLPISQLARLIGPHVARSMALTGSDPFFPTGTDLAVLFETAQPAVLENLLWARIGVEAAKYPQAKPVSGKAGALAYHGVRSPDRRVSSYVAKLEGAVVVTNSPCQLHRLAEVQSGRAKSIASLPEYVFFRNRYRLGDPEETAFVFLSDPTIRRWCGPRWRIADSRRTRVAAVLAELQAAQLDKLVRKQVELGPIHTELPMPEAGELRLAPGGVVSARYGSLEFMTPIGEIPLESVTKAEADAYERWRDGYQRNWNWAFDPIGLRISLGKEVLAADMTVMPLIFATRYREMVAMSQGASLAPDTGDPHNAVAHFIIALNRNSPMFEQANTLASTMVRGASLGWIGRTVEIYADDDPFWQDLAKQKEPSLDRWLFEQNIGRVPVAVRIESANSLKLAAFLTGLRAFVEQTAPGLTRWEMLTYNDQPYVKITPAQTGRKVPQELRNIAIYYAASPDGLTVTLSEGLLKRALDRQIARSKAEENKQPAEPGAKHAVARSPEGAVARSPDLATPATEGLPGTAGDRTVGGFGGVGRPAPSVWLGSNVGLYVDRKVLEVANALARDQYQAAMQASAWGNLPILNEWKRRFPDRDPVQVHQQVWGTELVCPGGGKYVWNERWQTMESTVYGHPGEPKHGPPAPPVLSSFTSGDFSLTFENQGLRARVALHRATAVQPETATAK